MSRYQPLWSFTQAKATTPLTLTFEEIEEITGFALNHDFLRCKKELIPYGYAVKHISMKQRTVTFVKNQPEEGKDEK